MFDRFCYLKQINYLRYETANEILVALDLLPLGSERSDGRGVLPVGLDLRREAPPHRLQQLDLRILAGQQRLVRCLTLQARREAHPSADQGRVRTIAVTRCSTAHTRLTSL